VARSAAHALGVGARGALDEHLERAPDEPLRALARLALDQLDELLHALHLQRVGHHALGDARRLGAAPRREHEREGAVIAHLLDHL
jgi:hypothetical protein